MAGIYIHIPFCRSRCIYCGFYSTTEQSIRQDYVNAVCREVELRSGRKEDGAILQSPLSTIYLGGGTPSQLSLAQLRQILDAVYKYNKVAADAEMSIEVNPDDVTPEFANGLRSLPINRVSMGAQTFDDGMLRWLGRRHTAKQVSEAVERLRAAGIRNISIDLMYGFPKESPGMWDADISQALALDVEHLSAYCLMIEDGTPLHRIIYTDSADDYAATPHPPLLDEEVERQMYERLIERLEAAGYEHYEISNFAKPGFRSRHNSSYWDGTPYTGIGAAAHSYDITTRSWNVSDLRRYIEGIQRGKRCFDFETLDEDTRYNDTVTVALRTREGIDLSRLTTRHRAYCMRMARRFIDDGLLQLKQLPAGSAQPTATSQHLVLSHHGLFVSDMIMAELMMV